MLANLSDYGPFAPVVGYGAAIMAAGLALFSMWGGKMEKWRPPDEDLPGGAQAIAILFCAVGMVLEWYAAQPSTIPLYIGAIIILLLSCLVCFLTYSGLLGTYIYVVEDATGPKSTIKRRILGGRKLLPTAEEKLKREKVDIQTLLEGASGPDKLWSREDRQWVKQRVLITFVLTLVLGTFALTGAGFAVQVVLSDKPASGTISTHDAPALK
jgi:hypothetical protein